MLIFHVPSICSPPGTTTTCRVPVISFPVDIIGGLSKIRAAASKGFSYQLPITLLKESRYQNPPLYPLSSCSHRISVPRKAQLGGHCIELQKHVT